jgi:hypothetical protein
MKARTWAAAVLLGAAVCGGACAQTKEQINQMLTDQEVCYGLGALANSTVLQRNAGKTLAEQLERRTVSLGGADTPEYKLAEDITRQVYDKDVKNGVAAAVDTHRACLTAKGHARLFSERAMRTCPVVGVMVAEIAAARSKGMSVEEIQTVLGDRYGNLPKQYDGGVQKLAAKYSEASKPESGYVDYTMCMVVGMQG